mgnify:CR=1 FL=1
MAQVDVEMPKMGESITEGTVITWHKQPGDEVKQDETLLEIGTDKVDTEVPSPAAGVLTEQLVAEGDTVEVGTVIARVETEAEEAVVETSPDAPADETEDDADAPAESDDSSASDAPSEERTLDGDAAANARAHFLSRGDAAVVVTADPTSRLRLLDRKLSSWPASTTALGPTSPGTPTVSTSEV